MKMVVVFVLELGHAFVKLAKLVIEILVGFWVGIIVILLG
jgi:hypothetical protein